MEASLIAKYGDPLTRDLWRDRANIGITRTFMRVDEPRTRLTWRRGGISIILDRQTTGTGWKLSYEAMQPVNAPL